MSAADYKALYFKARTDYISIVKKAKEFGLTSIDLDVKDPKKVAIKDLKFNNTDNLYHHYFDENTIYQNIFNIDRKNDSLNNLAYINLLKGKDKATKVYTYQNDLTSLLYSIQNFEKEHFNNQKLPFEILMTDDSIVTIITSALMCDNQPLKSDVNFSKNNDLIFQLVTFDNQIFIKQVISTKELETPLTEREYAKMKFETVSSLSEPYAEFDADKFEKRFMKLPNQSKRCQSIKKQIINSQSVVVLGSDVSCIRGPDVIDLHKKADLNYIKDRLTSANINSQFIDEEYAQTEDYDAFKYNGENSKYYLNKDIFKVIDTPDQAYQFEKFLFVKWLRAFISNVPSTVIGFVDDHYTLRGIEEYTTAEIPAFLLKYGRNAQLKTQLKEASNFYARFIEWVKESVVNSKEERYYQMKFQNNYWHLIEVKDPEYIKNDGFDKVISKDFKEWRNSLKTENI